MLVLGLSGSLRRDSHNSTLLRAAGAELTGADADGAHRFEVFEGLAEIPPYNEEHDTADAPESVRALREAIAGADALLIATPEYNGSIPGQLKNAIDWASRPYGRASLGGKPAAVIGASMSQFGAKWAQADLRRVLGITGAKPLERDLPLGTAHEAFDADGRLVDDAQRAELAELVAELRQAVTAEAIAA
jgi:chromate reductase